MSNVLTTGVRVFALVLALLAALPAAAQPSPNALMLQRATAAVVNVSIAAPVKPPASPPNRDPMFRQFDEERARELSQRVRAAGSGVIVDAQRGLVLTNHHVIANARTIVITLRDRRELPAQLVGSDSGTDIALLRVAPDQLVALPLADSDQLMIGEPVFAIGNPFGIGQTVTSGIVSALARSLGADGYEDYVQTDAPINPGNSGGALVNARGELAGINTALYGPQGQNVGIGFAVPTNMAIAVMRQLERFGEMRRGRIGVAAEDITPRIARERRLPVSEGALVTRVDGGSPAEAAGVRVGDIVSALNGKPVRTQADLRNRLALVAVGDAIELIGLRQGQAMRAQMSVAPIPQVRVAGAAATVPQLDGARLVDGENGVIVAAVEAGSAAHTLGFRAGDVLDSINRQPVLKVVDLSRLIGQQDRFLVGVQRGDAKLALVVRQQ